MLTESDILTKFELHGLPPMSFGIPLDFKPSHKLIENLTTRFKIEFAVMYNYYNKTHFLYRGKSDSTELPIDKLELLLKHSHPMGTMYPSVFDIDWLKLAQKNGSPQKQSLILPLGKAKFAFNIYSSTK